MSHNNPLSKTLDNFYPGRENLEAYKSLQRYIENPAGEIVFLLGPPSSGKSHLLRGVVHKICSSTDLKVETLTSEELKNRLITAITDGTTAEFWDHLINIDVLVLDDCQFLSYGIDDVVIQISENYHKNNKILIIAADYLCDSLREIPNLIIIHLVKPGYEVRKKILMEQLNAKGLTCLSADVTELICRKLENPRQIEGFVSWLYAQQNCT